MNKTRLKKYAQLIAKVGVNVQKGQNVMISASLDQPQFVEMLVNECYKAGAIRVFVDFSHQPLTKYAIRYCSEKTLGTLEDWQVEKWNWQADTLPAKIYLMSDDPDGLKGINQKKYAKANASLSKTIKPIRDKMENKYQWCIAAVPGKEWAKKVFPNERPGKAVEMLWEAILAAARVDIPRYVHQRSRGIYDARAGDCGFPRGEGRNQNLRAIYGSASVGIAHRIVRRVVGSGLYRGRRGVYQQSAIPPDYRARYRLVPPQTPLVVLHRSYSAVVCAVGIPARGRAGRWSVAKIRPHRPRTTLYGGDRGDVRYVVAV